MGEDMVSLGFVIGLDYRDVELSAHDVLQEFKTHPFVRKILEGGERVAWGAKTITRAAGMRCRAASERPGLLLAGESAGLVDVAQAEGGPLRDRVGPAGRRGGVPVARARRGCRAGSAPSTPTTQTVRDGYLWREPGRGAQHAPGVREGLLHRRRARERDDGDEGEAPAEELHNEPNGAAPLLRTGRAAARIRRRTGRSRSTSSRPCSHPATGRGTTSRTTCASSAACRASSPRCGRGCARPRSTRSGGRRRRHGRR